ncbi:MAG: cysteine desulfurase family protein [Thermoguttaceae bacterium]|jgi:cysteine desulfurase
MPRLPIYFDHHATTPLDPRVLEAMLPYLGEVFGNAGSTAHSFGWAARAAVDDARQKIAAALGARPKEIVFTSGATESNNLAIRGVVERHADRGRHIISAVTEHRAVLDPLRRLVRRGFEVTLLPVIAAGDPRAGLVRVEDVAEAIRPDTILVSLMLANNEIGAIGPLAEIGRLCHERGVLLHTDAVGAAGRIPLEVDALAVDLASLSGHKMYGPKGVGALYVRSRGPRVRLEPIIDGGGQEGGLRSGTLNVPGIVGMARAMELCLEEMPREAPRLRGLRDRLYAGLCRQISGVGLNGPALDPPELRLPGNLNVSFAQIEAETLILQMKHVAASTGSACTSANPEPSHVLRALGLPDEAVRGSVRFGLGRFNTEEEVDWVVARAAQAVGELRGMTAEGENR